MQSLTSRSLSRSILNATLPSRTLMNCVLSLVWVLGLPAASSAASHTIAEISQWASWVEEKNLGPVDVSQPELGSASWGTEDDVLGEPLSNTVNCLSLGEEGSITLGFAPSIGNGPGDDFAVFENGFYGLQGLFGELARVEISSNGVDFAQFETESLQMSPVAAFGFILPSLYTGFAGTEPSGSGSGFDLTMLDQHELVVNGVLDLQDVAYVRIVDVIGDGLSVDSFENAIYDPYPTPFSTSGFDLDGVGVIHTPEVAGGTLWWIGLLGVFTLGQHRRRSLRFPLGLALSLALSALAILGISSSAQASYVIDFEGLGLGADSSEIGANGSGSFKTGAVTFENVYNSQYGSWEGHAVSTYTDATTPGWANQFSAITGGGFGGSAHYGLFYQNEYGSSNPTIELPVSETIDGLYVTNTAYAYFSMLDGDQFAKQFAAGDFFKLTAEGFDTAGNSVGSLDFYLADFLDSSSLILTDWTWFDLSSLGPVKSLDFSLSSSDNSFGYMNTPAYFAFDNMQLVPEPGTGLLVGMGLILMTLRRQSR